MPIPASTAKTVVLHARVLADRGGGPEKTILAMPQQFRDSRYRPVAAYMHPPRSVGFNELVARAHHADGELFGVPDRGPLDPRPVRELLRLCRHLDVAVWHAHDYKSAVFGLLLRRLHPMRAVTTLHGWGDIDWRTRFYFAIDRLCLPAFDHVFAVSQDLVEIARRSGVAPRCVSMLANAVDADYFRRCTIPSVASERRRLAVPARRMVVATVGRLAAHKGFDVAFAAFTKLLAAGVDAEWWVVGDGPEREVLEDRVEIGGLAERVRFFGHRADVRPYLEASDVFLFASWREGTPNALLEAMAMEVPVVATAVGGVADLLDDGALGLVCEAGDAGAIAAALQVLATDHGRRRRLGQEARRHVCAGHTLANRVRRECEVYDGLFGTAPS